MCLSLQAGEVEEISMENKYLFFVSLWNTDCVGNYWEGRKKVLGVNEKGEFSRCEQQSDVSRSMKYSFYRVRQFGVNTKQIPHFDEDKHINVIQTVLNSESLCSHQPKSSQGL